MLDSWFFLIFWNWWYLENAGLSVPAITYNSSNSSCLCVLLGGPGFQYTSRKPLDLRQDTRQTPLARAERQAWPEVAKIRFSGRKMYRKPERPCLGKLENSWPNMSSSMVIKHCHHQPQSQSSLRPLRSTGHVFSMLDHKRSHSEQHVDMWVDLKMRYAANYGNFENKVLTHGPPPSLRLSSG